MESLVSFTMPLSHMEQLRSVYPNAYKPWSKEDDMLLAKLFCEGKTVKELMTIFQRNRGGITSKLHKLGLTQ